MKRGRPEIPDKMAERLGKPNNRLSRAQACDKMVDLINLYHSISLRHGTPEQKKEAEELITSQVMDLRYYVGTDLKANALFFLKNRDEWEKNRDRYV